MRYRLLAVAAAVALTLAAAAALLPRLVGSNLQALSPSSYVGGPFELTSQDGKRLSSKELSGKPFALFFGFTFCPDVCPTALLELSNVIHDLGPDADRMRYLFISVDSERDTPEQLKLYLSSFDPHIIGLSGTQTEIAAVAKAYRAYYEKVPTKDGFTYNHSALTYLMDAQGRFVGTIAYQESEAIQLTKLRRLIAGG